MYQDSPCLVLPTATPFDLNSHKQKKTIDMVTLHMEPTLFGVWTLTKDKTTYLQDLTNRPLEHTPNPQPTVYEGIPFIWGFGDV